MTEATVLHVELADAHTAMVELLRGIEEVLGVKIDSIEAEWIDVSSLEGERYELRSLKMETHRAVRR